MKKYFLTQVKRKNGVYEKGVVVKDTLEAARQSYHAYLGAYGYGFDTSTDYVACFIRGDDGAIFDGEVDDRRPPEEPEADPDTEG